MTTRKLIFSLEEYYHLYSRGVDKRTIFLDQEDRKRFVRLLFLCNSNRPVIYKESKELSLNKINTGEKITAIGAYCLMPNHFHLLIRETTESGVVKFMSKLLTAYSSYFNKKYDRTGSLFSSEFKSSHLDTDEYLKYIYSYIHLNPIKVSEAKLSVFEVGKERAFKILESYAFSSYLDYQGSSREENIILNKEKFPEYFRNQNDFKDYIFDWIKLPNSEQTN